jgi:hypothetical protein
MPLAEPVEQGRRHLGDGVFGGFHALAPALTGAHKIRITATHAACKAFVITAPQCDV